ncbi:MAG: ribose-phosphate diphosphokinase [Candidatus Saccharimonadales bacterium]
MSAEAASLEVPKSLILPEEIRENIVFVNGETHPALGAEVARLLGLELCLVEFKRFSNTEPYARIDENVRRKDIIAFQTHAPVDGLPIEASLFQHLQMIDAASRSHVSTIMAVAPNMLGARQDRQVLARESETGKMVAGLLGTVGVKGSGASELVTVDIHSRESIGAFPNAAADNLTAQIMLREVLRGFMTGPEEGYRLVSPDEGHTKALRKHAEKLGVEIMDLVKVRDQHEETVKHVGHIEDVDGATCFIMDDLLGTAGTVVSAAKELDEAGAADIYVAATHGWFSDDAPQKILDSPITKVFVTNTIPVGEEVSETLGDKLVVLSAGRVIAEGLNTILTGGSVNELYEGEHLY